jgi:hypothetical protein
MNSADGFDDSYRFVADAENLLGGQRNVLARLEQRPRGPADRIGPTGGDDRPEGQAA